MHLTETCCDDTPNIIINIETTAATQQDIDDECQNCSQRFRCTKSNKRGLTFPQEALQAARERQTTEAFKLTYRKRAGIKGTISQAVNALRSRQTRYRGLDKSHLQFVATAAAINVIRGGNWLAEKPKRKLNYLGLPP